MGDLIWFVLGLALVQPVLRRLIQDSTRRALIRKIERERGSRVIVIAHRSEATSLFGLTFLRAIGIEDAEEVIHAIQITDPSVPLDIVLHTPGGLVLAAVQIARAIRSHPSRVTAFVPHYAMSGGTLIALAADEIVMSQHAVLGPVDPMVGTTPAASLLEVVRRKPIADVDDETLLLADQAEKAIAQVQGTLRELLEGHLAPPACESIAHALCEGTWTHDFPISARKAAALGLPVSTTMPPDVMDLIRLHPASGSPQSVEYLPAPRVSAPAVARSVTVCAGAQEHASKGS